MIAVMVVTIYFDGGSMYKFEAWFSAKYPELYELFIKRYRSKGKGWMLWEWLNKEYADVIRAWTQDAPVVAKTSTDEINLVIKPVRFNILVS